MTDNPKYLREIEAARLALQAECMAVFRANWSIEISRRFARAALTAVRDGTDEDRRDRMEEALHQIDSWSRAYPLKVFPEPDFKRAAELLKAGGITLDAISASNMRHVVEGVGKIARAALDPAAKPPLMPIYGATEDQDVLGERKGEE